MTFAVRHGPACGTSDPDQAAEMDVMAEQRADASFSKEELALARERLIVALDVATTAEATTLHARLGGSVSFYKIGLELIMNGGISFARSLKERGGRVFLDVKFLDIANTVEKATMNAARSGADFLTVHAIDSKTLKAAARGAEGSQLKVLGVTVLTSLTRDDLAEQGVNHDPAEMVVRRAQLAHETGCHGVVASGQEARAVREAIPDPEFRIVTPGIRLSGNATDDQARVSTPMSAIGDGATHLVVGRPITRAEDPKAAADQFVIEIAKALRN